VRREPGRFEHCRFAGHSAEFFDASIPDNRILLDDNRAAGLAKNEKTDLLSNVEETSQRLASLELTDGLKPPNKLPQSRAMPARAAS
jgi:hypothetical protein